jgi:small multidrug resistance family-3 protein
MNLAFSLLILFVAALLEASGDALVRSGLHAAAFHTKATFLALGAVVLFAYGCTVNAPSWDFGRLLGIYVVFFFLVAQCIGWFVFHQRPGNGILVGGVFIMAGGAIVTFVR